MADVAIPHCPWVGPFVADHKHKSSVVFDERGAIIAVFSHKADRAREAKADAVAYAMNATYGCARRTGGQR